MIVIRSNLLQRNRLERKIQKTFASYRLNSIPSRMIELSKVNRSNEVKELIDFNVNKGSLDYKVNSNVQRQDSSWLGVKKLVLQKEMLKPPSRKKKFYRSDCEMKQSYLTVGPWPRKLKKTGRCVKQARRFGKLTLLTSETSLLT